jgi:hypothetical protein
MRSLHYPIVRAAVTAALLAFQAAAEAPEAVGGLRIRLAAERPEVQAGEALKLVLTFENVGDEPLRIFQPPDLLVADHVHLRVTGPGVVQRPVARPMIAFIPGPQSYPELAPGASRTIEIVLAGNPPAFRAWGIALGEAGDYRVQAEYRYAGEGRAEMIEPHDRARQPDVQPWRGAVTSNTVAIRLGGNIQPARGLRPATGDRGPVLPRPEVGRPGGGMGRQPVDLQPNPAR